MAQFQGDRDSRGPADFSGAAGGRYDEDGDDNDDDDDDSNRRVSKRKVSKLNTPSGIAGSDAVSILFSQLHYPNSIPSQIKPDYLPPVPRNGLPHLPNLGMGAQGRFDDSSAPSIGSLMPVSNDRVSSLRSSTRGSKRQRTTESGLSRSNSPPLDDQSYALPNSSNGAGGRMSTRGMRQVHAHDQPGPPQMIMQHLYPPPNASPGGYGPPQQYGQLFPLGGPGGPMSMGPPPGPIPPLPPRFEPQYDPALYQHQYPPNMIRQASVPGAGNRNDPGNPSEHREGQPLNGSHRERGGGEMFAAFLEADERSRQMAAAAAQRQHQDQLNWPSTTPSPSTPSAPSTVHPNQSGATSSAPGTPANPAHWFDMFAAGSGPTPNPPSTEGNNVTWSAITDDLARILNAASDPAPPPQQPEVSTTASAGEPVAGTSRPGMRNSDVDVGDSAIGVKAETAAAPTRQEAADEAEAEKDAEGEDDVDGGGGDKKEDSADMAIDPPQLAVKDDHTMEDEAEKEGSVGDEGQHDYEATTNASFKAPRGRTKKTTGSSRGRGKAKG